MAGRTLSSPNCVNNMLSTMKIEPYLKKQKSHKDNSKYQRKREDLF